MTLSSTMLSKILVGLGQSLTEEELARVIKYIHEVVVPGVIGKLRLSFTDVASWFINQYDKWIFPSKGGFPTVQTQWYPSRLSAAAPFSAQMVETGVAAAGAGQADAAAAPLFNPAKWLDEADAAIVDRLHMILLGLDEEVNPYSDAPKETRKLGDIIFDLFKQKFLALLAGTPLEGKISPVMTLKLAGTSIVSDITLLTAVILNPNGTRLINPRTGKTIRYSPDAVFINDSATLIALKVRMEQKIAGLENLRAAELPSLPEIFPEDYFFRFNIGRGTTFTMGELTKLMRKLCKPVAAATVQDENAPVVFVPSSEWCTAFRQVHHAYTTADAAVQALFEANEIAQQHFESALADFEYSYAEGLASIEACQAASASFTSADELQAALVVAWHLFEAEVTIEAALAAHAEAAPESFKEHKAAKTALAAATSADLISAKMNEAQAKFYKAYYRFVKAHADLHQVSFFLPKLQARAVKLEIELVEAKDLFFALESQASTLWDEAPEFTDAHQLVLSGAVSWYDLEQILFQTSPEAECCRKMHNAALKNGRTLQLGVFYQALYSVKEIVNAINTAEEEGGDFFLAATQAAQQTACWSSTTLEDPHFYAVVLAAVWNRPRTPIRKPLTEARMEDVRNFLTNIVNPVKSTLKTIFSQRANAASAARAALVKAEEELLKVESKAKLIATRAASSKKEGDAQAVERYAKLITVAKTAKAIAEASISETALEVIKAQGLISPSFIAAGITSQVVAHIMGKKTLESSVAWGGARQTQSVSLEQVMAEQATGEAVSLANQALYSTEAAAALAHANRVAAENESSLRARAAYHVARAAADPSYNYQMTGRSRPLRPEETTAGIKAAMANKSSPPQPAAAAGGGGGGPPRPSSEDSIRGVPTLASPPSISAAAPGESWRKPLSSANPVQTWARLPGVAAPVQVITDEITGGAAYVLPDSLQEREELIAHLQGESLPSLAPRVPPAEQPETVTVTAAAAGQPPVEDKSPALETKTKKSGKTGNARALAALARGEQVLCRNIAKYGECRNSTCRFYHPASTPVPATLAEAAGGAVEEAFCRGDHPAPHETASAFAEAAAASLESVKPTEPDIQAAIRARFLEMNPHMAGSLPPLAPEPAPPALQDGGSVFAWFDRFNPKIGASLAGQDPSALAGPIAAALLAKLRAEKPE
jgi:hypothetical protein